jgi:L-threonylcarbamoyladenylate synthase
MTKPNVQFAIPAEAVLPVAELALALQRGEVVLIPTDTLPALAALPEAATHIWTLKQRPLEKPLILMGADFEQLEPLLGRPWRREWRDLADVGWPGALTLVLPARGPLLEQLHPGGSSLGLRIPACDMTRALLRSTGPLATTSANPSGMPAAVDALQASQYFPNLSLLAPVPWPFPSGQASTVMAWPGSADPAEGSGCWQVLRRGAFVAPDPTR